MNLEIIDWIALSHTLGYANPRDMLEELYNLQSFSLKQISRILGHSVFSIREKMIQYDIMMRPRGGCNRVNRVLKDVPNNELFNWDVASLARKYNVHPSTVFTERRLRRARNFSRKPSFRR